ncbi:hypothetical protein [Burkholderia stagnalis]|uniref:hypothetical protein n=1 Tax=Burkholderia stagnalis TaxID=1503054 RepID=UPI000A875CF6|nr:hypothetical protein [Burkholderia stagnalis]
MAGELLPWSPQRDGVGGGSSEGPTLCSFRNRIYAAWKGTGQDERIFWSSYDGFAGRWSDQREGVGGGSATGPSLAVYQDRLFAAWKGVTGDDRMFWSSFDGVNWSPQQPGIGGGSSQTPALAAFQDHLYAVWKGAGGDQRMFWSRFDGQQWSAQQEGVGGGTSGRPALATFQGKLYAAWKGTGGDQRMFWSSFDGHSWSPQQEGIGGGTAVGPSLAVYAVGLPPADDRLFAAWRGVEGDQRMFWSMFDGYTWSPQQEGVGGGTAVRPALAAFGGKLYAAWKGVSHDDRMFWSTITVNRQPLQPVLLAPTPGQRNVPVRPQLRWRDAGAGTVRAAESFLVLVSTSAHPNFDMWFVRDVTTRTDYTIGVDIPGSTDCIWQISAVNSVDSPDRLVSAPANGSFSTAAEPSQPAPSPPELPSQPTCSAALDTDAPFTGSVTTMRISGSGFLPGEVVEVVEGSVVLASTRANQFHSYGVSVGFLSSAFPSVHKIFARGLTSGLVSNETSFSV